MRAHASSRSRRSSTDLLGLEVRGEQLAIRRDAREPLAQQRGERGVERDLVGDLGLIEQAPRRERVLDQHAVTEPVDREDRRVIERGHRCAQPRRARSSSMRPTAVRFRRGAPSVARDEPIEQVADAQPQLGDRLVGERDEQDLRELGAGEDEIDDAMLEEERLAGAGRRLDDDEPIASRARQRRRARG